MPSSIRRRNPGSQPRIPAAKSSMAVLSPRFSSRHTAFRSVRCSRSGAFAHVCTAFWTLRSPKTPKLHPLGCNLVEFCPKRACKPARCSSICPRSRANSPYRMSAPQPSPLAHIVRTRRRAAGFSQTVLGELAGVGRRFISDLEQSKPTLRLDRQCSALLASLELIHRSFLPPEQQQEYAAIIAANTAAIQ